VVDAFRLTWYERSLKIRLVTALLGAAATLLYWLIGRREYACGAEDAG